MKSVPSEHQPLLEKLALGLVGLGWVLRWLTLTEAASSGETLSVVILWLLAATLICWSDFRQTRTGGESNLSTSSPRRAGWSLNFVDVGLLLIVVGHIVGGAWLWITGGQLRFAVNLCWEWVGLLVTYWLLRRIVAQRQWRVNLLTLILASGVPLSLVGLWQHHYWYDQVGRDYLNHKEVYTSLNDRAPSTWTDRERTDYQAAVNYFELQQIPLDTDSLESWENRLLGSREPLGFFALTNSFAALLLFEFCCWLALVAGLLRGGAASISQRKACWIGGVVCSGLILYALLLTKSRTAWVALAITLLALVLFRWSSRSLRYSVPILFGLLLLAGLGWLTGAIDQEVISEAPRSLQYRFVYWEATAQALAESPWFGTGPGNFRSVYLQYRPTGASEEIVDPHQFLLDLWANGGLLAVIGALLLALTLTRTWWKQRPVAETIGFADEPSSVVESNGRPLLVGGFCAFLMMAGTHWLDRSGLELVLLSSAVAYVVLVLLLRQIAVPLLERLAEWAPRWSPWVLIALLIHLSAAGGIEMPGIVVMLLLLLALVPQSESVITIPGHVGRQSLIGVLTAVVLMGLLYVTAWLPVQQVGRYLDLAQQAQLNQTGGDTINSLYESAVAADLLDPSPAKRWGDYMLFRLQEGRRTDARAFMTVLSIYEQALSRDPRNAQRYFDAARVLEEGYQHTGDVQLGERACGYYRSGIDKHPTHAPARAYFALLLDRLGKAEEAAKQAETALKLDELNKLAGHVDQRLDATLIERLKLLNSKISE